MKKKGNKKAKEEKMTDDPELRLIHNFNFDSNRDRNGKGAAALFKFISSLSLARNDKEDKERKDGTERRTSHSVTIRKYGDDGTSVKRKKPKAKRRGHKREHELALLF